MTQRELFDKELSQMRKQNGMEQAARNSENLDLARQIARKIATQNGSVTADDVGIELSISHGINSLGPAAGSIFRGKEWRFTGEFVKSTRVTNHSRLLRVWRLA